MNDPGQASRSARTTKAPRSGVADERTAADDASSSAASVATGAPDIP